MRELADAINESVSDSSSFMAVMDKMENAGYEVLLVLEAVVEVRTRKKCSNLDQEGALQPLSPPRLVSSDRAGPEIPSVF